MQEQRLTTRTETPVIVQDAGLAMQELETRFALAVRQRALLETYIKGQLRPGKHFYQVGEGKPGLTKEGAEIICLAHGLKPAYEVLSGPDHPPADNTPYQLTVKATLSVNGHFRGEGIGSASSYITTRKKEFQPRQNDPGLCYNATLKMGQKSAYIAATLNATAASEFFTQDMEDAEAEQGEKKTETPGEHFCQKHKTKWFKGGKMRRYAHPIEGTDPVEWCNEPDKKDDGDGYIGTPVAQPVESSPAARTASLAPKGAPTDSLIDKAWLEETIKKLGWNPLQWIAQTMSITEARINDAVKLMDKTQQAAFVAEIEKRSKGVN